MEQKLHVFKKIFTFDDIRMSVTVLNVQHVLLFFPLALWPNASHGLLILEVS